MSYLDNLGSPVCSIPDCAKEMGIDYTTMFHRLKNYPQMTQPPAFRAGGQKMMMVDVAHLWIATHRREWEALQAAKQKGGK